MPYPASPSTTSHTLAHYRLLRPWSASSLCLATVSAQTCNAPQLQVETFCPGPPFVARRVPRWVTAGCQHHVYTYTCVRVYVCLRAHVQPQHLLLSSCPCSCMVCSTVTITSCHMCQTITYRSKCNAPLVHLAYSLSRWTDPGFVDLLLVII